MRWIVAHGGEAEAATSSSSRHGLHGAQPRAGDGAQPRAPRASSSPPARWTDDAQPLVPGDAEGVGCVRWRFTRPGPAVVEAIGCDEAGRRSAGVKPTPGG